MVYTLHLPIPPIDRRAVLVRRDLSLFIEKHTLLDAIHIRSGRILQVTPYRLGRKPFEFSHFSRDGHKCVLHSGCEPPTDATFVAQTGDPYAWVLEDLGV